MNRDKKWHKRCVRKRDVRNFGVYFCSHVAGNRANFATKVYLDAIFSITMHLRLTVALALILCENICSLFSPKSSVSSCNHRY